MKTIQLKFKTLLFLFLVGFAFTSCSKDDKISKEDDNNELAGADYTYEITLLNKNNNITREFSGSVPNTPKTSVYTKEGPGGKPTIVMKIVDKDTANGQSTSFYGYFTLDENQQPLSLAIDSKDGFEKGVGSALNMHTTKIMGLSTQYPAISGTATFSNFELHGNAASYTLELECVFRQEYPQILYHASGKIVVNPPKVK